ncbi:MAG: RNA polymerase sigma factor [Myxococcota bacterium]|nr:RNA polymerase sigma factor [Myxococcota bacterium]
MHAPAARLEPAPRRAATPAGSASERLFDEIYSSFHHEVGRWVGLFGGSEADCEDLVQDVFLVVHRRLIDFNGENVPGWLYQITRRRVRDYLQLSWFRLVLGGPTVDGATARAGDTPDAALGNKEKREEITRLLSKVPSSQRDAFVLFQIGGYSGEEIAHMQGVPLNTVWTRIYKTRAKLAAGAWHLRH